MTAHARGTAPPHCGTLIPLRTWLTREICSHRCRWRIVELSSRVDRAISVRKVKEGMGERLVPALGHTTAYARILITFPASPLSQGRRLTVDLNHSHAALGIVIACIAVPDAPDRIDRPRPARRVIAISDRRLHRAVSKRPRECHPNTLAAALSWMMYTGRT